MRKGFPKIKSKSKSITLNAPWDMGQAAVRTGWLLFSMPGPILTKLTEELRSIPWLQPRSLQKKCTNRLAFDTYLWLLSKLPQKRSKQGSWTSTTREQVAPLRQLDMQTGGQRGLTWTPGTITIETITTLQNSKAQVDSRKIPWAHLRLTTNEYGEPILPNPLVVPPRQNARTWRQNVARAFLSKHYGM